MGRILRRCVACNLPETYPGIQFDENGVCNGCKEHSDEPRPYWGEEALRIRIECVLDTPENQHRRYDAAVAYSGGRDSTYLLYYLKKVMNLSVVAVTLTHDFMPEQTLDNIKQITKALGVDVHYIVNEELNQCSRKSIQTWSQKPNAAMLLSFCTGCRYGIKKLIPDYCRKQGIPLLFVGNTRMEQMTYRQNLLSINQRKPSAAGKVAGYTHQLFNNPAMMKSLHCIRIQGYEFLYPYLKKIVAPSTPLVLAPLRDYFHCPEDVLLNTITQLGWKCDQTFRSTWRADCYVNMLRQYYYRRTLGFCDMDVYYAHLIRQGKVTLEQAKQRLAEECNYNADYVADILQYFFGVDFDAVENKIAANTPTDCHRLH